MSAKTRAPLPMKFNQVSRDTLIQSMSNQNFKNLKTSKARLTSAMTAKNKNKPLDTYDAISSLQYQEHANDYAPADHQDGEFLTI